MDICVECGEDGYDIDVLYNLVLETNENPQQADANAQKIKTRATHSKVRSVLPLQLPKSMKVCCWSAMDIKMAKIDQAVSVAKAGIKNEMKTYTFVIDYGQNMELPVYNTQQPSCTYY